MITSFANSTAISSPGYKTIYYAGESTKPYVENGTSLLIDNIINGGTPIPDPGGLPNGLYLHQFV
jgi:hypothetical protein